MDSKLIEVAGLHKRYPKFELGPLSFELESGAVLGLIGPNGAGKSTTIKLLLGLARPDAGTVRLCGLDHRNEVAIRQQVGYVGEEINLYRTVPAGWLVRFMSRFYDHWDDALCRSLVAKFRIPLDRRVKELSHGNQVKLAVTLALAHRPRLLLLDEPMNGLDPLARHDLLREIMNVVQDEHRSVLLSTHLLSDLQVADQVMLVSDGQVALHSEREMLLADWKQLAFPMADQERLRPYLRVIRTDGQSCLAITDCYRRLRAERSDLLAGVDVQPLDLDSLMRAVVRGEVG
ncbi:MAG TPA: ABC transporter ATP-binding protein [Symbiobacteriaceae bacterium]|nr:ABC transporter ATP-binding protein [Symbiobacteriaceae bacterium]